MNFNPDLTKQTQEVIFSQKLQNTNHPCLIFNRSTQKHLGIVLDSRLDFKEHLEITFKFSKTTGLSHEIQNQLPRKSLITIYKSFIRPHLDFADLIYDQSYNASFHRKLESIQYNVALAITGVIRRT